ncbi:hypothetical protein [Methylocapsa acidiphila]|uniref:hypothetical protein n=1 Tax=Methylocapsa acidiphila TaxID=133552 RepID=UPI00047CAC3E|nr:hypothetical protein [Methylocapsa acidiphila]
MARSLRHERRVLNVEEASLVENTHHPILASLSDADLAELRKRVRERRERATQLAARQRRELRGKADPRGAHAASDDSGMRMKRDLLAAAVRRLNKEAARRESKAAREALIDSAKRALTLRRANAAKATRPSAGRTPNEGFQPKGEPAGRSLRNPAKIGEISQHTKNMQAKHDAR